MEIPEERRFGECKICGEKRLLNSVIASYRGQLWAGWICGECFRKARGEREQVRREKDGI